MSTLHFDYIKNDWGRAEQRREAKITGLRPTLESVQRWFPKDGSYFFTTEIHEDDECPFRDDDTVPMKVIDCR